MSVYNVLAGNAFNVIAKNFMNQQKNYLLSSNNWMCLELNLLFRFIYLLFFVVLYLLTGDFIFGVTAVSF